MTVDANRVSYGEAVAWRWKWGEDGDWNYGPDRPADDDPKTIYYGKLFAVEPLYASPAPLEGVTVKGAAVKLIENRISEIVNEYGDYEPDTNFTNLPEWAETVIEELENLLSAIVGSAK